MDAVERAASGHPGMPMGTADFASVLFLKHLKFNPANPHWPDRDRFVLSAGHGSMLLYSLLHLSGYGLTLDDLKNFRQWGSLTPGHPEYGHTMGVETTTGPLGQGCGNSVGMALAEAMLAAKFNRDDKRLFDHRTYVIAGDGDLMEGLSHEAFALAGHWKLNKLILFYDSNRITIEGSTDLAYSDDVRKRFEAYHWNVLEIDGHDYAAIDEALVSARAEQGRPTIIIGHTHIGKGAPHAVDTSESHGAPLGADEIRAAKEALGLPVDQDFYVPQAAVDTFEAARREGAAAESAWNELRQVYAQAHPELDAELEQHLNLTIPENLGDL
ncbi:MAG: transketolase, partial [Verrucomicrobia bacterium]|nr:transketolase [Verrucomicrobiota bacterium]